MSGSRKTIYVYLNNTEEERWRPVLAEAVGNSLFRIVSENKNPDDEQWQFNTGDVVRCEPRTLFDCTHSGCFVAVEKAEPRRGF